MAESRKPTPPRRPKDAEFLDLLRQHNLNQQQGKVLRSLIDDAVERSAAFAARPTRRARLAKARSIHKSVERLRLDLADDLAGEVLAPFLRTFGGLLSYDGMEALLGRPVRQTVHGRNLVGYYRHNEVRGLDTTLIDEASRGHRREVGHRNGIELLVQMPERLEDPLRVEKAASGTGGRPRDIYRKHVIAMLAVNAETLGVRATPTAGGRFTSLCGDVLRILGLSDDGLEVEVSRVLEELREGGHIEAGRSRKRLLSKPTPD